MFVSVCDIRGLQKEELVLLTHGDSVDKVADGFKVVAQSGNIIAGELVMFLSPPRANWHLKRSLCVHQALLTSRRSCTGRSFTPRWT